MFRTQVYLTKDERDGLRAVSKATGRKQSELIREAVDQFLENNRGSRREEILRESAGMWGNRTDLPGFDEMRKSWDRC